MPCTLLSLCVQEDVRVHEERHETARDDLVSTIAGLERNEGALFHRYHIRLGCRSAFVGRMQESPHDGFLNVRCLSCIVRPLYASGSS